MCDLNRSRLSWYELLPYVGVLSTRTSVINRTGVIYDFFLESITVCCGLNGTLDRSSFPHKSEPNQQAVLNLVRSTPGTVGMPISLDAEFPYTPVEFVPVLETDGLFWVKVKEPKVDAYGLGKISTTGLMLLLVVITMTGYAAVILWLLESSNNSKTFSKSFLQGLFDSYWCAFISATTIGYGDKVATSCFGRLFSMVWVLFGICLVSTFTAITTAVMTTFMVPQTSKPKPFYDEFIGVLNGSFDYLVLVKKSTNSILYPDTDSLTEALNNGSTFNIVMDKHAYWIYRAKIHQNQSFVFCPGVQNPTSIGYIYNTNNASLLRCLKSFATQNQVAVNARLEALVKEAIESQPPDKVIENVTLFFGPHTYSLLAGALGILVGLCVICGLFEHMMLRRPRSVSAITDSNRATTSERTNDHDADRDHEEDHDRDRDRDQVRRKSGVSNCMDKRDYCYDNAVPTALAEFDADRGDDCFSGNTMDISIDAS